MKKSEFKKLIKPIVQECIKESLLADGILSEIIGQVAKGMMPQTIVEAKTASPSPDPTVERMKANAFSVEQGGKLKEHKTKLMAAIGGESYNGVDLFEGTTPAPAQGNPQQQSSPLSGHAPSDPGVDIGNLLGSVGRNWNAHMSGMKESDGK
jgi:hypothetical protein|tara:strand:+ start:98 stop:553 length:456 start_codon:yes stop_codon:yes gene_type:complete